MMSRAFVNEDATSDPSPREWRLPPRDDPAFDAAAAGALLEAARIGETSHAELVTGYRWGDPTLNDHITRIRREAIDAEDDRLEQVADRYLRSRPQA